MTIFIGTSGFSYHHWAGSFYPKEIKQSDWLSYYAKFFNTVELNVSFYRLPSERALRKWYSETPPDFTFALKGSRYITHTKKLFNSENAVKIFFERAKILGDKLPVILWQFQPIFKANPERLENFLKILQDYDYKHAFEFRDESWFNEEIYEILKMYNAALVVSDSPNFPKNEVITADFFYIRLHGSKALYSSEYSNNELKDWAKKIRKWSDNGDVFVYFNNDADAYATQNALEFKKIIK